MRRCRIRKRERQTRGQTDREKGEKEEGKRREGEREGVSVLHLTNKKHKSKK